MTVNPCLQEAGKNNSWLVSRFPFSQTCDRKKRSRCATRIGQTLYLDIGLWRMSESSKTLNASKYGYAGLFTLTIPLTRLSAFCITNLYCQRLRNRKASLG